MVRRTLSLQREPLAELTTNELGSVVGAVADDYISVPNLNCLTLYGPGCIT